MTASRSQVQLLRRTVGTLLEDFRIGSEFDENAKRALEHVNAAKAALAKWDAEDAKKALLLAKLKEIGVKFDSSSNAAKALKARPEYAYDRALLQKDRSTLEKALEKAEEAYNRLTIDNPDYVVKKSDSEIAPKLTVTAPDKKARVYLQVKDIEPKTWYAWDDKRWSFVENIPLGRIGDKSGDEKSGAGPGEDRLAAILGGATQGHGVPFDLVLKDGSRWEVKDLKTAGVLIRPGTEGRAALAGPKKRLESVLVKLKNFCVLFNKLKITVGADDARIITRASNYVNIEIENFNKGEVPATRFASFHAVLKAIASLKARWAQEIDDDFENVITLDDVEIVVDKPTFVDVARLVQRSMPDIDILGSIDKKEIALSALKDQAFDDPTKFWDDWFNSVAASEIFKGVSGVFIVNEHGFNLVPASEFDKSFKFTTISANLPKFLYVDY